MSKRRGGTRPSRQAASPTAEPRQPAARKWIWYRNEVGGRRLALEEFDSLETRGRAGLTKTMQRYRDGETRRQDVDALGDGIFELRYRVGTERYRLLFMLWGPHCVALTAFQKKQQKTPKQDLDRARARARHWREVFGSEPVAS